MFPKLRQAAGSIPAAVLLSVATAAAGLWADARPVNPAEYRQRH
ncbi:hypothetical protein [Neisseria weixii]|nr:hypothetical protein [Neisseria weixii]